MRRRVTISSHDDLSSLIDAYLESPAYRRLAPSTRAEYQRVADHLIVEIGAFKVVQIDRQWLRSWRDRWALHGHRAATLKLQVLKNALQPLVDDDQLPGTLFHRLNRVRAPGHTAEPHPVWRQCELEAVLDAASHLPGLVRAIGLARYAGLRRQDLCEITNDARIRVGQGRRIVWVTGKSDARLEHLEDPRLSELLDTYTQARGSTIAYNRDGRPWKPRQLSQALNRILRRLAHSGGVREGLTWHGLRHTRGVELAEAGCSDAIIMAQLGHTTDRSAQLYRRQASRRKLGDVGQTLVNAMLANNRAPI